MTIRASFGSDPAGANHCSDEALGAALLLVIDIAHGFAAGTTVTTLVCSDGWDSRETCSGVLQASTQGHMMHGVRKLSSSKVLFVHNAAFSTPAALIQRH